MTVLERPAGETAAPTPRAPNSPFLSGPVAPVPLPFGYRLNLLAVACAMVLLPLIYLALIAAAAAGTLLYVAYVWPQLGAVKNWQINLLVGGGPPIAGIVLVVYMLRSMIPRRRGEHGGIVLAYAAGPALHDLVQEIATATPPLPRRGRGRSGWICRRMPRRRWRRPAERLLYAGDTCPPCGGFGSGGALPWGGYMSPAAGGGARSP